MGKGTGGRTLVGFVSVGFLAGDGGPENAIEDGLDESEDGGRGDPEVSDGELSGVKSAGLKVAFGICR